MDDYTAAADKLRKDLNHLQRILDGTADEHRVALALGVAKRVRRDSTLLVQRLAAHRDSYSPKEGTS